jgi:hypothetical protein
LLALAVDEWRLERKDRALEKEYLSRLAEDLDTNLRIFEVQKRTHVKNRELADGLTRVILQWSRGEQECLPRVKSATIELQQLIETELGR